MAAWQPFLCDLTEMSALKEGVVQEWGTEKVLFLFLHLLRGAFVYIRQRCIHGYIKLSGNRSWEAMQCNWLKTGLS